MIRPYFITGPNGIPFISHDDIEYIAEDLISDYDRTLLTDFKSLDVEHFMEFYLGLKYDIQYLSDSGIYLGMMVFEETDSIPVYDPVKKRAEYYHADANTVLIDRWMYDSDRQERRYRFTVGHECSHSILHRDYFARLSRILKANGEKAVVRCRISTGRNKGRSDPHKWTDEERMEWQANALGSALLMPKTAVLSVYEKCQILGIRYSDNMYALKSMTDVFNVSEEAALYRLKTLNLISSKEQTQLWRHSVEEKDEKPGDSIDVRMGFGRPANEGWSRRWF